MKRLGDEGKEEMSESEVLEKGWGEDSGSTDGRERYDGWLADHDSPATDTTEGGSPISSRVSETMSGGVRAGLGLTDRRDLDSGAAIR